MFNWSFNQEVESYFSGINAVAAWSSKMESLESEDKITLLSTNK